MKRDIYTDSGVVDSVISQLQLAPGMRVIDLGCGHGVFLEAVATQLKESEGGVSPTVDSLASWIVGVDIASDLVADTIMMLERKFGNPLRGWDIRSTDALTLDEDEKFDLVVGNPPWVRIHHLDGATKALARSRFQVAKGAFNLYHLFIEKAIRLLKPGGQLALIVPQTLEVGPASVYARRLLSREGVWSVSLLSGSSFVPHAHVRPVLLLFQKKETAPREEPDDRDNRVTTLGSLASITSGVATGSDKVFIVNKQRISEWNLEQHRLKPVIKGRDLKGDQVVTPHGTQLIWPYRTDSSMKWLLDDLSDAPNVLKYLISHKEHLAHRPKLASRIERHPLEWYQFIDPNRYTPNQPLRIAIPGVFRGATFCLVDDPNTLIHNSCLQLTPKDGSGDLLARLLRTPDFWALLRSNSRRLEGDFRQTSVTELSNLPLTSLVGSVIV